MKKNILTYSLALTLIFGAGVVLAEQETSTIDAAEEIILDENVQAEDLGINEPNLLPDSPFYFLKEWGREIQNFFTFNPTAKIKLKEKFASEKLMELKKIIEQKRNREIIEKGIENYQKGIKTLKEASENIEESAEENEEVGKFLDKFIQNQALHQRILQKLENQIPPEVFEKIKSTRERHLENFGEVMTRLENKEKIQERLEKNLEKVKGSKFKNFKNLEVLLELEENVPESAQEAIKKAQENSLKRLKGDLEKMSPEDQEKFKDYIEKISGEKEKHMEIIENLKEELKENTLIKEKILQYRERILGQVKEGITAEDCPAIERPAFGFCKEGRIIVKRNEQGCIVSFNCLLPAEIEILPEPTACINLWDPVCGKNGKTYSNTCFAKLAGVEIDYKGKCKEKECRTDADCPQPRCGPASTISARCIGMKARCVEGKCQIISILSPLNKIQQFKAELEATTE